MARDLFELRNIARVRRMEFNHWELAPLPGRQHSVNPTLHMFWSAVKRNADRCPRRRLRARASHLSETFGPTDDEMLPAEQRGSLPRFPAFDSAGPDFEPQRAGGNDAPIPNVQTLKRSAFDLDAPAPQRARTTSPEAQESGPFEARELGDSEFRAQHGLVGRNWVGTIEIATGDFNYAMRFPVLRRPAYSVPSGIDGPGIGELLMRRTSGT